MYNIKTLNKISPYGLDNFNRAKYTWGDEIENPDAVLVRSASMHDIQIEDSVVAIARAGAGVNNIPVESCTEKGIVVFNTPGANANAVKEMVLLGLLMSARKVSASMEWVKTLKGQGAEVSKSVEKGKAQFTGPEIMGKKLGVVGLGAIGVLVANAAMSLGMTVYGYDPYISIDAAWGLKSGVIKAGSLKELYENSDFITLHVPYNAETKDMVNKESIAMMKTGVRIINFSRAELVSTEDILEALGEKKVTVYITDFPTDEMLDCKGVVGFPHLGASTPESEDNCAKMAALEVIDYLENGNIVNSVNLPNLSLSKGSEKRICIIHKNVVAMLSKISTVISESGINIENMANKSKKDTAYTILDVTGSFNDDDVVSKLMDIEDIVRVRVI